MKIIEPLKEFQTDLLFLLVGENPLPNAVSAALLAHPAARIILVHSSGTADYAQKTRTWLLRQKVPMASIEPLQVDEADPASIWKEVDACMKRNQPKSVGINYTGGTKLMSVHAHDAVKHWCQQKKIIPTNTYLDARRLRMVVEPAQPETGEIARKKYVGDAVLIEVDELLNLHRWEVRMPPAKSPIFPRFAAQIALLIHQNADVWSEWKRKTFLPACKPSRNFLPEPQLGSVQLSFPDEPGWQNLRQAFKEEVRLAPESFTLQQFAKEGRFPLPANTEAAKYLDGTWLEHYTMAALDEIRGSASLCDIRHSIETRDIRFEVDVAAMRGYQLFAFSCGTERVTYPNDRTGREEEDISKLKLKLFEAYTRATQIGGDEANTALVTVLEDPLRLERQTSQGLLGPGQVASHPRIKVFGRADFPDLGQKFLSWINERSGDRRNE